MENPKIAGRETPGYEAPQILEIGEAEELTEGGCMTYYENATTLYSCVS